MLDDCDFHFNCKDCGGRGVVGGFYTSTVTCTSCNGYGFVEEKETLEFQNPVQTPQKKVVFKKLSRYHIRWLDRCKKFRSKR